MATAPTTLIRLQHTDDPDASITCHQVGSYSAVPGRAALPMMRCFVSGGGDAIGPALGRYTSEKGGIAIMCDNATNKRACRASRTDLTPEFDTGVSFLIDCVEAAGARAECPSLEADALPQTSVADARTSADSMLRDSVTVSAGAAAPSAPSMLSDSNMTCLHTLTTRPVSLTVFNSGPVV
jgi:hypothetical protein